MSSPALRTELLETTPDTDPDLTSIVAKATESLGCGESVEQLWLPGYRKVVKTETV